MNFYIWYPFCFQFISLLFGLFFWYTGRLQYDAINASVIEFNEAISGKYNFLQKGFQAMGSMQEKKRFKVLHKYGYGKNRVNTQWRNSFYLVIIDFYDFRKWSRWKQKRQRECTLLLQTTWGVHLHWNRKGKGEIYSPSCDIFNAQKR